MIRREKTSTPKRGPGRPSRLTEAQWQTVGRRLAQGEGVRALAREFKVSPSIISNRFSKHVPELKTLAARIAQDELDLEGLTLSEQTTVRRIADDLKLTASNLGKAAVHGSQAAMHLFTKAAQHTQRLKDDLQTDELIKAVETIHAIARAGNESAKPALALLKIFSDTALGSEAKPLHSPGQLRRMAELMERGKKGSTGLPA